MNSGFFIISFRWLSLVACLYSILTLKPWTILLLVHLHVGGVGPLSSPVATHKINTSQNSTDIRHPSRGVRTWDLSVEAVQERAANVWHNVILHFTAQFSGLFNCHGVGGNSSFFMQSSQKVHKMVHNGEVRSAPPNGSSMKLLIGFLWQLVLRVYISCWANLIHEGVSKIFRIESITK
jgi:hypothetical protein